MAREFEWDAIDGRQYRWDVEGVLTQVSLDAWYHRGQIAQLVAGLGGVAVDTDYIFWCKLAPIEQRPVTRFGLEPELSVAGMLQAEGTPAP